MGANAQRRRAAKTPPASVVPFERHDTRTMQRLRERMWEVTTLSQFEEIVAGAHPDNRASIRRLLKPMLRPGLPCCGPGALALKLDQPILAGQHTLRCPSRNRVVLTDGDWR